MSSGARLFLLAIAIVDDIIAIAIIADVTRAERFGLAALAGIGFTVSLLIAELAFDDPALVGEAKVGIFAGSILSGLFGAALLLRRGAR